LCQFQLGHADTYADLFLGRALRFLQHSRRCDLEKGSSCSHRDAQYSESRSHERRSSSKRIGPASQIIAANAEENTNYQNSESRDRLPATLRLGPPLNDSERHEEQSLLSLDRSADRIPATQRLGPISSAEAIDETDVPHLPAAKRKPGRPPGKKTRQEKSKGPVAAVPPRRTTSRSKPSPIRRKDTSTNAGTAKGKKNGKTKKGETSRAAQRPTGSTASDHAPIINLVPRSTRRRMDFRTPSLPAP